MKVNMDYIYATGVFTSRIIISTNIEAGREQWDSGGEKVKK